MIELRPYQRDAVAAILTARNRGVRRQLVSMPTGTGKTIVFASLAREIGERTLILAHRDELIGQAVEKVRVVWPGAEVGIVKAERNEIDRQVVVASVQTLSRPNRLEALDNFALVVTDEAHHAVAPTYQRIYSYLDGALHVGVTATPGRGDKAGLDGVYDELVFHLGLLDAIRSGYLCDLRGLRMQTAVDLSAVHTRRGDFADGELAAAVNVRSRNLAIVETWLEHAAGRPTVAFTADVQHAHDLAETYRASGVKAEPIHGELGIGERRALLSAFHRGEIDVLTNCALLVEGYDEPAVSCIVVARPTQSQSCYVQMVGRGTRLYPGKRDCQIIDVADIAGRHSLVQLPNLFGKAYQAKRDGRPTAPMSQQAQQSQEETHQQDRVLVQAVDLFARSAFHWLRAGDSWLLALPGLGQVRLQLADGKYWPCLIAPNGFERLLSETPLDLGWAQGLAEDEARRLLGSKAKVIARDAPWREEPASSRQLDTLRRLGVRCKRGLTKGEASDMIGKRVALRGKSA